MQMAILYLMVKSTRIKSGSGRNSELLFLITPGKVKTQPFLPMDRLELENLIPSLDMVPTRELSLRLVLRSLIESKTTMIKMLNSKLL
jgi:hypothetical protein